MKKIIAAGLFICCTAFKKEKVRDTDWFYGDSVTLGNELPNFSYRWTAVYCRTMGLREENQAGSGQTMESGLGKPTFDVSSVPVYDGFALNIFIAYGINDIQYGGTPAGYATATQAAVNGIKAKGWPADKIVLVWDWYPAATTAVNNQWLTTLKNVAINSGTSFLDFYTPINADPNNSSYTTDGIHPDIAGNIKYASLAQTNIVNPSINLPPVNLPPAIKVTGRKSKVS